ncbi:unnamed protein product [Arabidopsis halleri]
MSSDCNEAASRRHAKSKTAVWWDLDTCPVPDGYDARRAVRSIESALKDLGYKGSLTITAIGNMQKFPNVLRQLCSAGIKVKHAIPDVIGRVIMDDWSEWQVDNPPPATMMFVSEKVYTELTVPLCKRQQRMRGYNLLLAYTKDTSSILYTRAHWLWKDLLMAETRERHVLRKCSELVECESASCDLFCTSCDFTSKSFEHFTTHLSTEEHSLTESKIIKFRSPPGEETEEPKTKAASQEYAKSNTAVWWDLYTCPVPDGYDARLAVRSIESALKGLGYNGPLTITAIGDMQKNHKLLRQLCSAGIKVKHVVPDVVGQFIVGDLTDWQDHNRPPATMMFISDKLNSDDVLHWPLCRRQQWRKGYNLLLARTEPISSTIYTNAQWFWKDLLVLAENRRELVECESVSCDLFCASCDFTGKSFKHFTKHLSTEEHALTELKVIKSRSPPEEKTEEPKAKAKPPPKTSKRPRKTDFRLLDNHLAKSKRLRKAIRTDLGLLDNHLRSLRNHLRLLRSLGRGSASGSA